MSGSRSRSKGRRGETAAKRLLQEHDWEVLADTSAGISSCDLVACKNGVIVAWEVKNREIIHAQEFTKQATRNATGKMRWGVLAKIAGTSSWLCLRQGEKPVCWHERGK